jgi:DNA repair protein RadC
LKKGKVSLSNAELIAILNGSGNRQESAVALSKIILLYVDGNINELVKWKSMLPRLYIKTTLIH